MPDWTPEQLRAIETTGNLLVSAAAGAGKTAVMTERIARLIAAGTDPERLLVVTFTNAAAAEMKQRIEKRVFELALAESDPKRRRELSDAAAGIGRANISTIHSFCGNVLRRNYHLVGIDPAFRTLDAPEAELLMKETRDDVIEEAYAAAEEGGMPGFEPLLAMLGGSGETLDDVMSRVYSFIIARPDPLSWLSSAAEAYSSEFTRFADSAAKVLMDSAALSVRVFYLQALGLHDELLASGRRDIADKIFEDVNGLFALGRMNTYDEWYAAVRAFRPASIRLSAEEKEGGLGRYIRRLKGLTEKLRALFSHPLDEERSYAAAVQPAINAFYELMRRLTEEYSARKRERSVIDFNDLEHLTLAVLRNEAAAEEYRKKFIHIFIDEYQDTNLVQEAIINAVSRGDNLFMVGDVKQSIYRFRQAEPDIFNEKYRRYDGVGGTKIDLNANFRSASSILNAANRVFSELMRGEVGEIDYSDNAALRAGADVPAGEVHIELTELDAQADDDDAEPAEDGLTACEAEARLAAQRIRELMEGAEVFDRRLGRTRRPRYSDFAVLLRKTRDRALPWVNTLTACGIPCAAELKNGYFNAIEVMVFMNLLRVIDNRRQDIPMMSVMRSPIGGFTDEELIRIRSGYEGADLFDRLAAAAADDGTPWGRHAKNFLGNIARWHELSLLIGVDELIGRLLDETLYYSCVGVLPGGEVRQANLDMLAERAHAYEANGERGLYGFIRLMDGISETSDPGAAQVASVDAVRVMSIHQSKGLEFPIVFIGGIAEGFNKKEFEAAAVLDRDLGIGLKDMSGRAGACPEGAIKEPLLRRAISARSRAKSIYEEMRILYVGMTRARERLFMLGAKKGMEKLMHEYAAPITDHRINEAQCFLDWLLGAFFPLGLSVDGARGGVSCRLGAPETGDDERLVLYFRTAAPEAAAGGSMTRADYEAWSAEAAGHEHTAEDLRLGFRYPYEADTATPSKRSVTELLETGYEYTPAVPAFMSGERRLTGAERGTAAHKLLNLIPLRSLNAGELRAELERLAASGKMRREEADVVSVDAVMRLLDSELWQRVLRSGHVERELEFTLLERDGAVLQGVIDCCFEEDGEWVVIDYKTTSVAGTTPDEVAHRYTAQLDRYAAALSALTGRRVKERWLYLLSASETVQL